MLALRQKQTLWLIKECPISREDVSSVPKADITYVAATDEIDAGARIWTARKTKTPSAGNALGVGVCRLNGLPY
jgi:hypothetical protein